MARRACLGHHHVLQLLVRGATPWYPATTTWGPPKRRTGRQITFCRLFGVNFNLVPRPRPARAPSPNPNLDPSRDRGRQGLTRLRVGMCKKITRAIERPASTEKKKRPARRIVHTRPAIRSSPTPGYVGHTRVCTQVPVEQKNTMRALAVKSPPPACSWGYTLKPGYQKLAVWVVLRCVPAYHTWLLVSWPCSGMHPGTPNDTKPCIP